jgi:hypothetical protein
MEFRIADTFTGSLARLTADEQKAVKTTAFDLRIFQRPYELPALPRIADSSLLIKSGKRLSARRSQCDSSPR